VKKQSPHILKKVILGVWAAGIAVSFYIFGRSELTWAEIPGALHDTMLDLGSWGPAVYILIYTLRPLVLFPATLLTMAAGLVWGPLGGTFFTIVGENLSAAFAFWIGRTLGRQFIESAEIKFLAGINKHLSEHGFMTVLIMRLTFMPFDAVNYGCGMTHMRFRDYFMGTFLGVLPGVLSFVYAGAAWYEPKNLVIAAIVLAASFVIAHFVKQSKSGKKVTSAVETKKIK
jgi:uncharacterized membrane protein YdjX (TVP38/TMEM64 family)